MANEWILLEDEINRNPLVAHCYAQGLTLTDCIKALVKANDELLIKNIKLEQIVPRKIKINGEEYIYRVPSEYIESHLNL